MMDGTERARYLSLLRSSRNQFLAALADVSEPQASFRPAPDRWSIQDIAEHIAVTEHGMFRLISTHFEPLQQPVPGREEEILSYRGIDRSRAFTAPERTRPSGRYGSLKEAADQFAANRERTIQFIEECQDDLRARMTNHPLGSVTCQECLAILITHPLRHLAQIEEIRNSPYFPV